MLLASLTVLVMLIVAYAYWREGPLTAFTMFCNVFLAGLVACNFWEPIATQLEPVLSSSFLSGYEDIFCLLFLFCVTLGMLRWVTNSLASMEIEYPAVLLQGGAVLFGLATGYLLAGFLVCALQTLPWNEDFLGFSVETDVSQTPLRRLLPPDRLWLAVMRRTGAFTLANSIADDVSPRSNYDRYKTFDRNATFELRYARYRRYTEKREPMTYHGECEP